ncbi:DUF254-domain-containing protein [Dacryopinax primogenitus]|uniref:Vacuolar fusion protein MON1 n=1 Tax=Dacryopinax primogenitus (strain DJM 731) TaxID=1858805 RepID=M5G4Z2_DACPD|nr:DUF254-domain-containing protein [Dacryopinax primogenitus]EJT98822.1 DUF254-domain-containing protein [Dacryopinax primogenitus]
MSPDFRPPTPKDRPHSRLLPAHSLSLLNITPSRPASPVLAGTVELRPSSFVESPAFSSPKQTPSSIGGDEDVEQEPDGLLANEPSPEESLISASPPSSLTAETVLPGSESASHALREQLKRTISRKSTGSAPSSPPAKRSVLADEVLSAVSEYPPLSPEEAARYEDRKYFVLTNAGKPVFISEKGDSEEEATNAMGIMQALISVFAEDGDKLRYITTGSTRITFLLRTPLYYVSVSSWGEPAPVTRTHLEYLHLQILSVLTLPQLTKLFERRGNFDLGRLLTGAEPLMRSLLNTAQTSLETTLAAMQCLRIDMHRRRRIGDALLPPSKLSLVYALVIAGGRVITLVRPRKHSINPSDLRILLNTIASPSLLTSDSESWLPICLPKYNADRFLYTYVGALREGIGIVGLSPDRDAWDAMREWRGVKLEEESLLGFIEKAVLAHPYAVVELGIHGLRHFVYKSRIHVQYTQPEFDASYDTELEQRRLVTLYQQVHDTLHARSGQKEALSLHHIRTPRETVMGWTTKPLEVYIALSPHLPEPACVSAAHMVVNWVKKEEGRLFLKDAPVF